jgi:hypothetical protein
MTRYLCAGMWLALLLAGCNGQQPGGQPAGSPAPVQGSAAAVPAGSDEDQVRQTVLHYDRLLSEGYRTLNMNPLGEVAIKPLAEQAYIHMAAIGEGQARLLSTLVKLDFSSVQRTAPGSYLVKAHEIWDFSYADIKTGKVTGKVTGFVYDVNYTLKKEGGRWMIHEIAAVAPNDYEPKQEPRTFTPHGGKAAGQGAAVTPPGHPALPPGGAGKPAAAPPAQGFVSKPW